MEIRSRSVYHIMIRAHDHVWFDRSLNFQDRYEACSLIMACAYQAKSAATIQWGWTPLGDDIEVQKNEGNSCGRSSSEEATL